MNIYERILNILLEARVEMFIQDRLDEGKVKRTNKIMRKEWERQTGGHQARRNVQKYGTGGSGSHELEQAQTADHRRQAHAAGRGKRADEARFEKENSPAVKSYIRDMRAAAGHNPNVGDKKPEETGIDLMNKRQQTHHETHGKAAVSRAIKARGKRTTP